MDARYPSQEEYTTLAAASILVKEAKLTSPIPAP
jgi:hypothetical protein